MWVAPQAPEPSHRTREGSPPADAAQVSHTEETWAAHRLTLGGTMSEMPTEPDQPEEQPESPNDPVSEPDVEGDDGAETAPPPA